MRKTNSIVFFITIIIIIIATGLFAQSNSFSKAVNPDKYENDDTLEKAKSIKLNEVQDRTFSTPMDADWVKVKVTNTDYYEFHAIGISDKLDCAMQLYASDGIMLAANDNYLTTTLDAKIFIRLTPGTYFLKVYTVSIDVLIDPLHQNRYALQFSIPGQEK